MDASLNSPSHWILLAALVAATIIDIRIRRIPNLLSLGAAALGLLLAASGYGSVTLAASLGGLALGLAALLPLYLIKAMGAGDVKLMAAVGAFLGPSVTLAAVLCTFIAGALIAIIVLIARDGLRETAQRYWFGIKHLILSQTWLGARVDKEGRGPLRFPYAGAILCGSVVAVLWSTSAGV
ncbi:MAG: A24 family peptidase [Nevskia sp.]|nr:A24 family peptidase [Nevskia sp.]